MTKKFKKSGKNAHKLHFFSRAVNSCNEDKKLKHSVHLNLSLILLTRSIRQISIVWLCWGEGEGYVNQIQKMRENAHKSDF